MSGFEDEYSDGLTPEEMLYSAIFGKPRPDWEGYAIPSIPKFRNYQSASRVFSELFPDSENVRKVFTKPEPFQENCGGSVTIFAESGNDAVAVFENRETVLKVLELLNLVDILDVSAEKMLDGSSALHFSWYITDTFLAIPE